MKKKAVFIVKDHKTYMNAEEARYEFCHSGYTCQLLFIIPMADPNHVIPTLKESLNPALWDEVLWFTSLSNYDPRSFKIKKKKNRALRNIMNALEYMFNFIDVKRLNRLSKKIHGADLVFTVHRNLHEHFAAKIFKEDAYILDSGQTLDKIGEDGYIDYSKDYLRRRTKRFLYYVSGFKIIDRARIKLFTVYAEAANTKHQVVKNEQRFKRSLIQKKSIGEQVVFVSSPFYRFTEGISIEVYIKYLFAVIEHLEIKAEQFIYVPNPIRESDNDIQHIIQKLGCELDDRLIPVESKVATYKDLPKLCITPSSTAIVNISIISGNKIPCVVAWHPEFDCFEFLVKWRSDIAADSSLNIKFELIENSPAFFNTGNCINGPEFQNFNDWWQKARSG